MNTTTTTIPNNYTCPECETKNPMIGEDETGKYCAECGCGIITAPVEDVIIEDVIILSTLHVHPCVQEIDESDDSTYTTADDTIPDAEADFFGVYHIDAEGYEWWVKDFDTRRNAETFIMDLVNNSTF